MEEKNTAEVIEGVKRQEPVRKDDARAGKKKKAMVLVTVVLVALVVVSALAAVDYDALFDRVFDQKLPEPEYAEPDYHENIFENREYMQHAFSGMQVFVSEEGGYSINYAFGDSENDLPMLTHVSHSVAMGNAPENVKRRCAHVAPRPEQDGIARALTDLGLISPIPDHILVRGDNLKNIDADIPLNRIVAIAGVSGQP